jgi:iron complex transport system substrate-binding protein
MNSDWLEKTPLGRAEWIRFFGALYDRDSTASERFRTIANNYKTIKSKLIQITDKPTVMSGALFQDVWNMPAGDSFMAHFLKDAEADYLWKDSSGTGSLSLSLESVLEKGRNAEYWISPGFYTSVNSMINDSPHYEQFSAFKTGTIYTYASKKGATGGVLYFELATTRPDLVLKDLVHIFHPTIFPKNKMTFFDKLK